MKPVGSRVPRGPGSAPGQAGTGGFLGSFLQESRTGPPVCWAQISRKTSLRYGAPVLRLGPGNRPFLELKIKALTVPAS